jgi:hypothetical protein
MDDGFLQVQDGGGAIKGFGLALIDRTMSFTRQAPRGTGTILRREISQ